MFKFNGMPRSSRKLSLSVHNFWVKAIWVVQYVWENTTKPGYSISGYYILIKHNTCLKNNLYNQY